MAMSASEIAAERRRGRLAGVAAIAGGLLMTATLVWYLSINSDRPTDNDPAELRFGHHHAGELIAASLVHAVAALLIAVAAVHLYRATRARNPDLNRVVLVTAVAGAIGFALGPVALEIVYAVISADFAGRQVQSIATAKDLLDNPAKTIAQAVSAAGSLSLAFWFVLGSLNAMRVGLLTRFMGILGIAIGPCLLLFAPAPFVMTIWLVAVGLLFLGYWPRGLPPAWDQGEAVPWPSMAAAGGQPPDEADSGSPNGEVEPVGPGVRKPGSEQAAASETRNRRKRKRRR
jgi:hypothetical protein